jgi:hypothetical protein
MRLNAKEEKLLKSMFLGISLWFTSVGNVIFSETFLFFIFLRLFIHILKLF